MSNKSGLAAFLASNTGKRCFNIFYSWGAAIVIIGALFKILHLPYANQMLMFGMITEAVVFFISAFDDSQAGIDSGTSHSDDDDDNDDYAPAQRRGGNAYASSLPLTPEYSEKMSLAAESMDDFAKVMSSLNEVSLSLLGSYKQISDSSKGVSENSVGFSQSIKSLNSNVLGLNEVYEAQLTSVKDQIQTVKFMNESLDRIKTLYEGAFDDSSTFRQETEKMTQQIQALNAVYARLLQAMTASNTPPTPLV